MKEQSVPIHARVVSGIGKEREALAHYEVKDVIRLLEEGKVERAVGHAFFFSSPDLLEEISMQVGRAIHDRMKHRQVDTGLVNYVAYSVLMAIGLSSALVRRRLGDLCTQKRIVDCRERFLHVLRDIPPDGQQPKVLLDRYGSEVYRRYLTEGRTEEEAASARNRIFAGTLYDYVDMTVDEIHRSNLYRYALTRDSLLETETVWGNDYGAFLQFALWCGASFQTTNHDDVKKMIEEIRFIHAVMSQRLGGCEPNISFKIHGTRAGLRVAEVLGKEGFSITVTLCFSLFQAVEFAKVLARSTAAVNSVVIMNGRLAFPVRDELLARHPGQEDRYAESAKWVGVDISRHLYGKLYASPDNGGLGINLKRVRVMNASLRIYGDEIPDIMAIWGTPSITIFPNVRHALDRKVREFTSGSVKQPLEESIRRANADSQIFRQSRWIEGVDRKYAPKDPLNLFHSAPEAVVSWKPIAETLEQFIDSYEDTGNLIDFLR